MSDKRLIFLVVIIGIGIAMAVLFPAGRDSYVAKSRAIAMCGRNLYYIMEKNNERPNTDEKWINPQECLNSVEFFNRVLSVNGINVQEGCFTDEKVSLWNVAINVPECYGELFPVLISANFNLKLLAGDTDETLLPIGRKSGAHLSLLDDKAIIVVRKNGMFDVIKSKYCNRKNILKSSLDSSDAVYYLTPSGKMTLNLSWRKTNEERD